MSTSYRPTAAAVTALIILLCLFPAPQAEGAQEPASHFKKAIIIFDDIKGDDVSRAGAVQISNLLGHFRITSYMEPASLYEKGDMNKYDVAFFAGCQKDYAVPAVLLDDILAYRERFFWIGNHIDQLEKKDEKHALGIHYKGHREDITAITYRGTELPKSALPPVLEMSVDSRVKIHAWASGGGVKLPYIMESGNFWFIADIPFSYVEGVDRYIAFCDILHYFLNEAHPESHRTFVRIEDVTPITDPEKVREIADLLSGLNTPFMVSLVPVHVDPATDQEIPLSSRPRLVRALKYALSKGGSIVLHGHTHQRKGSTANDSEFWDEETGKPVKEDSPRFVDKKMRAAIDECLKCTIYPLLWETPQYAASVVDYRSIARYFSTTTDRRMFFNRTDLTQSFPYIIEKDSYGQRIIPEFLGFVPYIDKEGKQDAAAEKEASHTLVTQARRMLCMRDNTAGFFFHPFLAHSILADMVKEMKAMGYTFLDARDISNSVTTPDKAVVSGKGDIQLSIKNKYLREYFFDEKGRVRKEKISLTRMTQTVKRHVTNRPRWIYMAEGIDEKPAGTFKRFFTDIAEKMTPSEKEARHKAAAAIVWKEQASGEEKKDQEAFLATLESLNINTRKIHSLAGLGDENILIIPCGSAKDIPEIDRQTLEPFFERGGALILDGFSNFSRSMGFSRAGKVEIKEVRDLYNDLNFFTSGIMEIAAPRTSDKVVFQSADGLPLGMIRKEKEGGIFFLSTMYDPLSGKGYSRFPTLINVVLDYFNLDIPTFNPRIEAYFDPGLRENESVEVLARRWRNLGIRAIHVASWHFYPSYVFDYKRLLSVCHKQGIAVYAWVELPYLTQSFWNDNPSFREKNFQGKDLKVSWRYPVALEDPACQQAVFANLKKLLSDYEFDGINIAELYFEGEGLDRPDTYGPFHPSARQRFKDTYHYTMTELFSPSSPHYIRSNEQAQKQFFDFREELILELHRNVLVFLDSIRKERKDFDILFTVVDSIKSPEVRNNWGVDSKRIAALMKEIPFTFVVEDPTRMWDLPPERYQDLSAAYLQDGIPVANFGIDLNVVDVHREDKGFATRKQTGAELYQMLHSATRGGPRVIVYAESSIFEHDLPYMASAVDLPAGVVLPSPHKKILDPIHLLWTSCDLRKLEERGGEELVSYDSPTCCYMALNREPMAVWVENERMDPSYYIMGTGDWIVRLPSGRHDVRVVGESRLSFDVEVFSYFEAQLLIIFGVASCGLLVLLFLVNRIRRRKNA